MDYRQWYKSYKHRRVKCVERNEEFGDSGKVNMKTNVKGSITSHNWLSDRAAHKVLSYAISYLIGQNLKYFLKQKEILFHRPVSLGLMWALRVHSLLPLLTCYIGLEQSGNWRQITSQVSSYIGSHSNGAQKSSHSVTFLAVGSYFPSKTLTGNLPGMTNRSGRERETANNWRKGV